MGLEARAGAEEEVAGAEVRAVQVPVRAAVGDRGPTQVGEVLADRVRVEGGTGGSGSGAGSGAGVSTGGGGGASCTTAPWHPRSPMSAAVSSASRVRCMVHQYTVSHAPIIDPCVPYQRKPGVGPRRFAQRFRRPAP